MEEESRAQISVREPSCVEKFPRLPAPAVTTGIAEPLIAFGTVQSGRELAADSAPFDTSVLNTTSSTAQRTKSGPLGQPGSEDVGPVWEDWECPGVGSGIM